MKCSCGGCYVQTASGVRCTECWKLQVLRLVWYRSRSVSYSREMNEDDLQTDGRVRGEDAWWEPWK